MFSTDSTFSTEPITLLIDPTKLQLAPASTPPEGVRLVAGERRLGHSINNLLTVIFADIDSIELLGSDADERFRATRSLREAANRILQIVRDAMQSHRPSRTDLSLAATEGQIMFNNICENRGIRLVCDAREEVPVIAAPAAILDIVANLVSNAIEACDKRGDRVTVQTCRGNGEAILRVSDTGRGMNAAVANRLFHEDYTSRQNGHGIGLLTVLAHVADAHGKIRLTTRENGGTSFELLFPAAA